VHVDEQAGPASADSEAMLDDLLRYLQYKEACVRRCRVWVDVCWNVVRCVGCLCLSVSPCHQLRSMQGAGPNPVLEAEMVAAGHARDTVRFFLDVHTTKKEECVCVSC
jgi:hypothetical protein